MQMAPAKQLGVICAKNPQFLPLLKIVIGYDENITFERTLDPEMQTTMTSCSTTKRR